VSEQDRLRAPRFWSNLAIPGPRGSEVVRNEGIGKFQSWGVRRVVIGLLATVGLLFAGAAALPVANAQEPTLRTFVVQLSPENEPGGCQAGVESGAGGVAVVQINADTGEITYRVVAFNLPAPISGPTTGAHIHGPASTTGTAGIVVDFERTDLTTGLIAEGTTIDSDAAAILANPQNYYVNIHTEACPSGTIRGQLA
jgi:CHRD domain